MLELTVKPHRRVVLSDTGQPQKLFVLIQLGVARGDAPSLSSRGALEVAVDTSGSMFAKLPDGTSKIDRAIDSIAALGRLRGLDRDLQLGIVQFDTDATVVLPLSELGAGARKRLAHEAQQLRRFGGGTNLARALELLLSELSNAAPGSSRKVVVLTDGETTDEPECRDLSERFADEGIALICVGLGSEYNEDFLAELADKTNGFLYHLSETDSSMERLGKALEDTLRRSKRELVTDVRMRLDPGPGTIVQSVSRVYPMVQHLGTGGEAEIRLGNLDANDQSVLVAELELPPAPLGHAPPLLVSTGFRTPDSAQPQVVRQAVQIDYTTDKSAAAQLDDRVVFFVQQARVDAYAREAVQLSREGRTAEAQDRLQAVRKLSERLGNRAMQRAAERAVMELASSNTLLPDTAKSIKVSAKTLTILSPPTRQQLSPQTKH